MRAVVKQNAVRGFGGTVRLSEPTLPAREARAPRVLAETGATLVHPYNDWRVIAGQGTAALELLDEVPELDAVIAPLGGGGLLSGTAIAAKGLRPCDQGLMAPSPPVRTTRRGRCVLVISFRRPIRTPSPTVCARRSATRRSPCSSTVDGIGTVVGRRDRSRDAPDAGKSSRWSIEPSAAVPLGALLEHAAGRRRDARRSDPERRQRRPRPPALATDT